MVDAVNKTNDGAELAGQPDAVGTTNAEKQKVEAKKPAQPKAVDPELAGRETDVEEAAKRLKKKKQEQSLQQDGGLKEEETAKPQPDNKPDPLAKKAEKEKEPPQNGPSRFFELDPTSMRVLKKHPMWGMTDIDEHLAKTLENGGQVVKPLGSSGIDFKLNNGHTIEWRSNFGYKVRTKTTEAYDGIEFIGVRTGSFLKQFDETDAKAVVALSKARGWESINVHGKPAQKDMLWLEAQRQGLLVENYSPSPTMAAQWEKEKQQMEADKHIIGVNNAADGVPIPSEADKKGPEEKKAAAKKPEQVVGTTEKPISNFQTKAASKRRKPGARTVGPIEGETTDQYFSRKINNAKTDEEKEGFRALAAALQNGDLNIEDVQMTKLLRDELSGTTIAQELSVAKKVLGGLSPAVNDSIIKRDITTTSENAAAKAEGSAVKAETAKPPKAKAAAAATP